MAPNRTAGAHQTTSRDEIPREEWRPTLDDVTEQHKDGTVTIEVVGRDVGDQFEAIELPFSYLEYDDKDDVAIVAVGGRDNRLSVMLRHMIPHPARIFGLWEPDGTARAVAVVDPDGIETIVTFV